MSLVVSFFLLILFNNIFSSFASSDLFFLLLCKYQIPPEVRRSKIYRSWGDITCFTLQHDDEISETTKQAI